MLERKTGIEASAEPRASHGGATARRPTPSTSRRPTRWSRCRWLRSLALRAAEGAAETSWFLGLNFGPDHYVLAYRMLIGQRGDARATRLDAVAPLLRHPRPGHRLGAEPRRAERSERGVRGLLRAVPKAAQLESISLAFSVVSRESQVAFSGHFGPSRPYVVGIENVVSPANDVVLTYANGRDLRYWDVAAELTGTPYVSSELRHQQARRGAGRHGAEAGRARRWPKARLGRGAPLHPRQRWWHEANSVPGTMRQGRW